VTLLILGATGSFESSGLAKVLSHEPSILIRGLFYFLLASERRNTGPGPTKHPVRSPPAFPARKGPGPGISGLGSAKTAHGPRPARPRSNEERPGIGGGR
jgi:hypothetical protein